MKKLFFSIILISIINLGFGQSIFSNKYKRYSLDVYTGLNSFHGDIKGQAGFVIGTRFNWQLTSSFALYTSINYSGLRGYDQSANHKFVNNLFKVSLGGEAYLFNILGFDKIKSKFQPFLGLGIGATKSSFKKSLIDGDAAKHLYNNWYFCYQASIGLKYKLTKSIDINIKTELFSTKTDVLDNYNSPFASNKNYDAFNEFTIGVSYHFGNKSKEALIWKAPGNAVSTYKPSKRKNKFKMIETDSTLDKASEEIISSDVPIPANTTESTYQDVDEHEFDCIIKY